jgi:hypothetical protein
MIGKVSTHTDVKAYDPILVSDAVAKGLSGLKLDGVNVHKHRHGKGEERRAAFAQAQRVDLRNYGQQRWLSGLSASAISETRNIEFLCRIP